MLGELGPWGLRKEAISIMSKCQVKQQVLVEATASYPEHPGTVFNVEEVTAEVVEIARELGLEVEPEDVIELLQPNDKTLMEEGFLLIDG